MVDLPESCYRPPAYREFPERHAPGVRALLYDSLPYRARPTRVFAWVGVPGNASSAHPVPGMVLVHGGLGTAFPGWVRYWNNLGYAAIAMDTCGAMPPQDQLDVRGCGEGNHWPAHADGGPAGWGNFDRATAAVEEQWCFHALAAVIEAHSLLRSLPGVDPEKIGITGVSWGGVLSCLAAGVDERFRLAMPVYGCGCFNRESGLCPRSAVSDADLAAWQKFWDPRRYLAMARQPFLWLDGTNDAAFPLSMLRPSIDAHTAGVNALVLKPELPHLHGAISEEAPELLEFCEEIFHSRPAGARFSAMACRDDQLSARLEDGIPLPDLKETKLYFPRATGFWSDRRWNAAPARFEPESRQISAKRPEGATAYFFSVTTSGGTIRTSPVQEII